MKELDDFLGAETGQAEAVQPSAAEEPPKGDTAPAQAQEPARDEPEAAPQQPSEAEGEPPAPEDVEGLRRALQASRKERKDYKGERDRLSGEVSAIRSELEALRKQAAAPQPPPAPVQAVEPPKPEPMPDPTTDLPGYLAYQRQQHQEALINERFNMSEAMLRQNLGDADVDAKLQVFRKAIQQNPALGQELRRQVHPYRWAYDQAQRMIAMEEIGTDPAAYRQKTEAELRTQLEGEIRAKLEAEYAATAPVFNAPRVTLPQSLGTARSAAPRGAVPSIPEDFDDIFRKKR